MKSHLCLISFMIFLLLVTTAKPVEMIGSKDIGVGRTLILSRMDAGNLLNTPSISMKPNDWKISSGYHRRFEIGDLDKMFIAAAMRKGRVTIALGASQFGRTDLYAEQLIKGSITYHLNKISVGGTVSAFQVPIGNDYGTLRAVAIGGGFSLQQGKWLFAGTADNINEPSLVEGSTPLKRYYSLFSEFSGNGSFIFTGRIRAENLQTPRFGLGQLIQLSDQATFFWGFTTGLSEYGGGIDIDIKSTTITYATSIHPILGLSHTITFSYCNKKPKRKTTNAFN